YFKQQGIHTVMLTGDSKKTGEAIGRQLHLDEIKGNVMPEDKAAAIQSIKDEHAIVSMGGDRVNDAPALVRSDIGIAMSAGTDIAVDVSDAVLMKNDLTTISYIHQLSKKLKKIIIQNILFALLIVIILVSLNIIGDLSMTTAVIM